MKLAAIIAVVLGVAYLVFSVAHYVQNKPVVYKVNGKCERATLHGQPLSCYEATHRPYVEG